MKRQAQPSTDDDNPVMILTIANGAGHISVAEGLAAAIREARPSTPVMVVDVAEYMGWLARFTHVTAYLWLVKHAPALWDRIDRYQKRQEHTSPEWYYRRGLRRLFELARRVRPRALVATEVGCCEIAALIKRDLALDAPLVAVNDDYDADHAWVQPEVDLYCFMTEQLGKELVAHGAEARRVVAWGASLRDGFKSLSGREEERAKACLWLDLDTRRPLVIIAGGGEGMGRIEEMTAHLLTLKEPAPQLVVLAGNNARLKARCERLATNGARGSLRVLGWTDRVPGLMSAADLMVSKLGSMFNEALAAELPIVALEPPPGSERVQYHLLEEWGTGRAVRTLDEAVAEVARLLSQPLELDAMRAQVRAHRKPDSARRIARWLDEELSARRSGTLHDVALV
ncbi:MAG: processive 1,2-diacylglycerol beta-glucosyltransferase [Acidobacteriota bacterium]|jgi:processive 1,2-diacylglycerol beta-glucosyltransferase|nr:processive 1,2-diacylglycerol beta-glucosyltransferase [Acidobacteriota bacterium]MDT7779703.1 processive 1,2-diacylglycerol beta-glucosyltransferase [Acidobacteriota bacterium]